MWTRFKSSQTKEKERDFLSPDVVPSAEECRELSAHEAFALVESLKARGCDGIAAEVVAYYTAGK